MYGHSKPSNLKCTKSEIMASIVVLFAYLTPEYLTKQIFNIFSFIIFNNFFYYSYHFLGNDSMHDLIFWRASFANDASTLSLPKTAKDLDLASL